MSLSWEDVANMGYGRIGISSRVTSLTGSDKASIVANSNLLPCRDEVLEGWDWKAASARAQLTKDPTPPAFGYANRYMLPASPFCLVVREFRPQGIDYVIEGRYLLTDADSDTDDVFIRYTSSVDDPSMLSALCLKAIAWKFAAAVCNTFVQGNAATGQPAILKEYMLIIEEAQGSNQWLDFNHDEDSPATSTTQNDEWAKGGTSVATW